MRNREKIVEQAQFIVDTKSTIRSTANVFGMSKTTLHVYVTKELKKIDPMLYKDVRKVLDENKAQRHIRGGQATRERYRKLKEN